MSRRQNNGRDGYGINSQIGLAKVCLLMHPQWMKAMPQMRTVTMASRIAMCAVASNAALAVVLDVEHDRAVRPNAALGEFERIIVDAVMDPPLALWTHPKNKHEETQQ